MKIKATVSISTLSVHELAIDLKKVSLSDGKGTFTIDENVEATVSWRVRDTPGKKYKIEIKPESGKLTMRGNAPHPVELKIPKKYTLGAGHRVFRIVKEQDDE